MAQYIQPIYDIMLTRRQKFIHTNHLVKLCSSIAVVLFIAPFYFESQTPETREVIRRELQEFYKKSLNAHCNESANRCGEKLVDQNNTSINKGLSVEGKTVLLAVFEDGVRGNYETAEPTNRTGPGEYGYPVPTAVLDKEKAEWSILQYGFNMVTSDKIALDRVLPDKRLKECQFWHYPGNLPSTSVIVVFHNEGWSTLLRTVNSVINTSPRHLLNEVILIDDYSDEEHLQQELEVYVEKFEGLVKLYRNDVREGLIRSRIKGALLANADVIIFLDAHCECTKNWLPPLLTRIAFNRTIMAVPIIDSIDWNTFEYKDTSPGVHRRGLFDWSLLYKENVLPIKEEGTRRYRSEPYRSPTHVGGIFAMNKKYFFELGGYDPGLERWGGENLELSFKIWQCGGIIEWVPCSRVGYVYKHVSVPTTLSDDQRIPTTLMNYMRVVEVWFDDEHKRYFYRRQPWLYGTPLHHLQPQTDFRRKSNCKSFKWFMANVAYDVSDKFPVPQPNLYWGQIRPWYTDQCWSFNGQNKVYLLPCSSRPYQVGQFFRLDTEGHLMTGETCLLHTKDRKYLLMSKCDTEPKGLWEYNTELLQIKNKDLDLCVEADDDNPTLKLNVCKPHLHGQRWIFKKLHMWK